MIKIIKKINFPILCIVICTIFCIIPALNLMKFIPGHDSNFHLSRILFIENALKNLKIPTYISCYDEINYADSILYPSLFLNIPSFINLFTKNLYVSANIFRIIIIISSFIICYKSINIIIKDSFYSSIFTIIYNLNFYTLFNIYDRDALGEVIALVFIPLLIAGIYSLYVDKNTNENIYTIALTCILQSHIITFYYVLIFLIIFNFLMIRIIFKKKILKNIIKANFAFLLLNIWFIVPFLDYYKDGILYFTQDNVLQIAYVSTFKNLFGAFEEVMFYNTANHYGFEHIVIYILTFIMLICLPKISKGNDINKDEYNIALLSFILFNFYFIFTFKNPLLDILLKIDIIKTIYTKQQIPLRIIGRTLIFLIISFTLSLKIFFDHVSKYSIKVIKYLAIIILCIVHIFLNYHYINEKVKVANNYNNEFNIYVITTYPDYKIYDKNEDKNKYISKTTKQDFDFKEVYKSDNVIIKTYERNYLDINVEYEIEDYNNEKDYFIDLPFINYKYFSAKDNDSNINTYYGSHDNNIRLKINNKNGMISVTFKPPIIWLLSKWISILTIIIIFRKYIYKRLYLSILYISKLYKNIKLFITKIILKK